MTPIPADVYAAARRVYVLSSRDLWGDDERVLAWAQKRWPGVVGQVEWPWLVAFWVLSIAAQDGHE